MQSILKTFLISLFFSLHSMAQKDSVVSVLGTHCTMIPPKGFVIADRFKGFQNNSSGSTIMVSELNESYDNLIEGLTPEAFLTQKMIITKTEKISFNGNEATLFTATQSQNGIDFNKILLVFGAGSKTILVNGIYPVSANKLEKSIRTAVLSAKYVEEEFKEAPQLFTISTEGTTFKKVKSFGFGDTYSTDTLTPKSLDSPIFIVTNSVSKISKENRKSYAESRIMKLPRGDENKIISTTPITIDNLNGYEILAEGISKTGSPETIYQVILYNIEGDYYIMVGTATQNIDVNIQLFKKMAGTFKLRPS